MGQNTSKRSVSRSNSDASSFSVRELHKSVLHSGNLNSRSNVQSSSNNSLPLRPSVSTGPATVNPQLQTTRVSSSTSQPWNSGSTVTCYSTRHSSNDRYNVVGVSNNVVTMPSTTTRISASSYNATAAPLAGEDVALPSVTRNVLPTEFIFMPATRNAKIKNLHGKNSAGHVDHRKYTINLKATAQTSADQSPVRTVRASDFEGCCKVPGICAFSLTRSCKYEKIGCTRLHADTPYHWQFNYNTKWCNFRKFQSNQIESSFCKPEVVCAKLSPLLISKCQGDVGKKIFDIFGNKNCSINFNNMYISSEENENFKIRRLSTSSAAVFSHRFATVFEWYWQEENNLWIKYGEVSDDSRKEYVPGVTCEEIEKKFLDKRIYEFQFTSNQFKYKIDFRKMVQINLETNKQRNIRRRPNGAVNVEYKKRAAYLPEKWTGLKDLEVIAVSSSSQEYKDIVLLLQKSHPCFNLRSLKRVENRYLWQSYNIKFEYLSGRCKGKLEVQKLFHGTRLANVDSICQGNLDWRLHGYSHGNVYGRGTYFTNDLTLARSYCSSESPCNIFIVRVIVGDVTLGSADMVKPPINPQTNLEFNTTVDNMQSPRIFVKYDSQEYFPEYVLEIDG